MAKLTDFGAVANARQIMSVATTASSSAVVAAQGTFTSADIGKNIVIAGAGVNGAKLSTTITAVPASDTISIAQSAGTTLAVTGASLGTDCAGALQAALNGLATNGGGELIIDGEFLLVGTVTKNFHLLASSIILRGNGSTSALIVACSATATAIVLGNLVKLNIEGIDFVGTPNERNDARFVLDLQACLSADVQGNSFYGLANIDGSDAAVIRNQGGALNLLRNSFGGCMIAAGGIVQNVAWQRFESAGNRFIDYGQRNEILHSGKTGWVTGLCWIMVNDPIPASAYESGGVFPPYPHAAVNIRGDIYDEGTKHPILINSPTKLIAGVRIIGCRFNVNGWVAGTTGIRISNVADVLIEHCSMGYCTVPRSAIYLNSVRHARIAGVTTNGTINTLQAHTMEWLELVNSPALSNFLLTNVTRRSVDGVNV
jgi:hypothetical protein